MSTLNDELPVSSQLSSLLSDPPPSDDEELGEITVDLSSTIISPPHGAAAKNSSKMPSKKATSTEAETQHRRGSRLRTRRRSVYRVESSEDEIRGEIQASPCASKTGIPAKRSRVDSTASKASSKPTPKPVAKKTKSALIRGAKRWEPEFVTQNEKSPLVTGSVDLRTLLLQPAAWDVLSAEDKKEILALMPAETHILDANTPNARPNIGSLRNNDTFRHDAEEYVANMGKGMHDPAWLKDAWNAHQRRAMGDFDEFYIRKIEVDWNTDIPDEHRPEHLRAKKKAGPSASGGEDDESRGESHDRERSVSMQGSLAAENGVAKVNGSVNGSIKDEDAISTSGTVTQTLKRKASSDASDSATGSAEKICKSHSGSRFAVISDEVEANTIKDHKEMANGYANGATKDTANITASIPINGINGPVTTLLEEMTGAQGPETNTLGGEIAVGGRAMELVGQVE